MPISEEVKDIAGRLRQNDGSMERVSLACCNDEEVSLIAEALKTNTTLKRLCIVGTRWSSTMFEASGGFTAKGAMAIANALEANTTLKELDLSDNSIGAEGAKAIARALEKNKTLTALDLRDNNIGDEGAIAIANALRENYSIRIKRLNLNLNNIGDDGAIAIAKAVVGGHCCLDGGLDLSLNHIGIKGATAIAGVLCGLKYFMFIGNRIADEGEKKAVAEIIIKAVLSSRVLMHCQVDDDLGSGVDFTRARPDDPSLTRGAITPFSRTEEDDLRSISTATELLMLLSGLSLSRP